MGFMEGIKSIAAKFKPKKQDGIYCLSQERDGGAPAPIVLGTIGGMRPSTVHALVMQMTSAQREEHVRCFGASVDPSRIQELYGKDSSSDANALIQGLNVKLHDTTEKGDQQR